MKIDLGIILGRLVGSLSLLINSVLECFRYLLLQYRVI